MGNVFTLSLMTPCPPLPVRYNATSHLANAQSTNVNVPRPSPTDTEAPQSNLASMLTSPVTPSAHHPKRSVRSNASMVSAIQSRYHIKRRLGTGASGAVFHVVSRQDGCAHALKVIDKARLKTRSAHESIANEITMLESLRHPNIINFHHAYEDRQYIFIATEFYEHGDLYDMLRTRAHAFSERQALVIIRQVFSALEYMHAGGVSHRDVKLENLLVGCDGRVCLADFGLMHVARCGRGGSSSTMSCGTITYAAPEIMDGRTYLPTRADMWSCGITMCILLMCRFPFHATTRHELRHCFTQQNISSLLCGEKLRHVSVTCRTLLAGLLRVNPCERISVGRAISLCDFALDRVIRRDSKKEAAITR